jgi:hypothetical protein
MRDDKEDKFEAAPLQEFTDVAINFPPGTGRRVKHLDPYRRHRPRNWWWVTAGVAAAAFLFGWLLGRG